MELCFNDFKENIQIRIAGKLDEIDDNQLKDEICEHPSREFLKPWKESGPLENFYASFKVFKLNNGKAICWTMATNFEPKKIVELD